MTKKLRLRTINKFDHDQVIDLLNSGIDVVILRDQAVQQYVHILAASGALINQPDYPSRLSKIEHIRATKDGWPKSKDGKLQGCTYRYYDTKGGLV
jgi:hypothetical protein